MRSPDKQPLEQIIRTFNAGRYRACVEPLETWYFEGRHPGYKGLLQLSVALLQLELGLTKGPAYLLANSQRLLAEAGDGFAGLDVPDVLSQARSVERWLHGDRSSARPGVTLYLREP